MLHSSFALVVFLLLLGFRNRKRFRTRTSVPFSLLRVDGGYCCILIYLIVYGFQYNVGALCDYVHLSLQGTSRMTRQWYAHLFVFIAIHTCK